MTRLYDVDENRRRFLVYLLATGTTSGLAGCSSGGTNASALALPAGRSIYKFSGDVRVNGKAVTLGTPVKAGDHIETFGQSYVIFVVNKDATILRSHSRLELPKVTTASVSSAFTLQKGKALTVLASRKTQITTPSAVIGIRGTGVYLEVEPELTYVCTCYGVADLATKDDPAINETVTSAHHDSPKYILADSSKRNRIQEAPFKNHDDQELLLIESLVGRTTPFVVPKKVMKTRSRYF
jgi:hypothetical protein